MKFNKRIATIAATIGGVVTIYSSAAYFGADLPRPAWSSELIAQLEQRDDDRLDFLLYKRKDTKRDWYENQQQQLKFSTEEKPKWLLDEQNILEEDLKQMESEIKALEQKKFGN